jgi:hypothetical protein
VALSRRSPLSLHLRGWVGALLLAAAWLSGHFFGKIHACRHSPRVLYRKVLRPALHGIVRASGIGRGRVARAATAYASIGREQWTGTHRIAGQPLPSNFQQTPLASAPSCSSIEKNPELTAAIRTWWRRRSGRFFLAPAEYIWSRGSRAWCCRYRGQRRCSGTCRG